MKFFKKDIKKPFKLTAAYDKVPQCLKVTKVAHQTIKIYQEGHLFIFLYSYNRSILLTNKIIK
jgi:hypothetical protein